MIKPGSRGEVEIWGPYRVNKVAELRDTPIFSTKKWGETRFLPTIAEIQWADGNKNFWFRYWIGPVGKERYGQYGPMVSENDLLELLREAIRQEFFSQEFLSQLGEAITQAVAKST